MDFNLTREQHDIIQAAREFASKEFEDVAVDFDREERFDLRLWKAACDLGFVGVFIDEAYGGAGYGFLEHALITEEFWAVDPGIGTAILAATFGAELLLLHGSEDQKRLVLPKLAAGEAILATAVTEPGTGSDVAGASTTAVRDGDEWVVNGSKMFITGGDLAHYVNLFALTNPDHPSRHQRHSFLLVPTDTPGFEAVKLKGKMGVRASHTAELFFSDVRVPAENLIGEEGEGFSEVMDLFNRVRPMVAAMGVGVARGALDASIRYARKREAFGAPIGSFQLIQAKLAEMATLVQAARALYYQAAWLLDQGMVDHSLIAMAKWYAGEIAVRCADEAVQIHGGYGYMDEYKVQRFYRDAKIVELWEGTKEIEKLIIARRLLS